MKNKKDFYVVISKNWSELLKEDSKSKVKELLVSIKGKDKVSVIEETT